jgi:Tfp pilus assembly protein PilF
MTAPAGDDDGNRLERALQLFLAASPGSAAERDALLRAHPDLADLLAPMCGDDPDAATSPTPAAPAVESDEQVLGDFRLVRELGRGGMGVVYEAWQRSLDRRVAVKVLAPALVASPSAVARFRREAAAIGRLHHANIVEVHGFGTDGDRHFFAMQLVFGKPLDEVAARFRSPRAAVALCAQLADALAHAHAQGLVHRDVKPANVLVRDDDTPLLTDFGVAHDDALPSVTREGGFVGTLDYASPEQVRGEAIDARTDIWSLGVILHELLAAESPFAATTQEAVLRNILTSEPPPLRRMPGVDRDLTAMLARSLAKERHRRYATAAAFSRDLRAWLAGEPVSARLPGAGERLWRWAVREPWRAVAAGVLLLGLPAAAAGIAFTVARAPLVELGESRTAQMARQHLLAAVWIAYGRGDAEAALALLPSDPRELDDELAVTRFLLLDPPRRREMLPDLQRRGGPACTLLCNTAAAPGRAHEPTTNDPLECFAGAVLRYALVTRIADDDETAPYRPAMELFQRTTLLAEVPQAHHLLLLARAAARAGDDDVLAAAEAALQRHFGDLPGIPEQLELGRALRNSPEKSSIGDLAHFERLAAAPGPQRARALFNLAVRREQHGDVVGAEANLRESVTIDPKYGRAWSRLGKLLGARGERDEALVALRTAVAVEPDHARGWNNLGTALLDRGDLDGAEQALRTATTLVPDYARAHYNLGVVYDRRKNHTAAVDAYQRALALAPDYDKAQVNLAWALWYSDRRDEALQAAERAVALRPQWPNALHTLTEIASRIGNNERSEWASRRWVAVEPQRPEPWHRLGMALLRSKRTSVLAEALAAATRAAELGPADDHNHLLVANAKVRNGDKGGALAILERLLASDTLSAADRQYAEELRRFITR